MSPYKEQFKDYWATPIPFADREYGEKPKLGDPVPARRAASTIIVAKNKHVDKAAVENGEDNDYKVLMMYREGKGRYMRDQFVFPSFPVSMEDTSEDWDKILRRRGVTTKWPDLHHRLTAHRALLSFTNILVIPKEGGGIAEVEGPPGPQKWHLIIHTTPKAMKRLVDVLELPMENVLNQFIPFRHIVTPVTETFRFDNLSYLVPFEKIPDVNFTLTTVGERLVWVSPMEAMARFNAGIMNMPTPNIITLSELTNECPTFADVTKKTAMDTARTVLPELYHHNQTKVATVVLPGDIYHTETTADDRAAKFVRRFVYQKDYPYGVRAVFEERPATVDELAEELVPEKPALLEEANEMDLVYASVPYPQRKRQSQEHQLHMSVSSPSSSAAMGEGSSGAAQGQERLGSPGRTAYKVPEYVFQEGPENEEGVIPSRMDHMSIPAQDMFSKMDKE